MARPPKPLVGYNTNVKHLGLVFHVQTEDSGYDAPHVYSHLFKDGAILSTRKASYLEKRDAADREAVVRRIMQQQHKELLKELKKGLHDQKIANLFGVKLPEKGAPAPVDDEVDETSPEMGAAGELPALKGPPTERIQRLTADEVRAGAAEAAAAEAAAAAAARPGAPPPPPVEALSTRKPAVTVPVAVPLSALETARIEQRPDSRTAEVLAALERESDAEAAPPPPPAAAAAAAAADGSLPAWFGASRLFEDDEPTPPSGGPSLAQQGGPAVGPGGLQLPSWPSVTMPVASLMSTIQSPPHEGGGDETGKITERMRIPPVIPPAVNPPVPGRGAPAPGRRATPAYMARPAGGVAPVSPAQAMAGARTPTPPASPPPSARPGGPGQTASRLAGMTPTAPPSDSVVARPVFRVGAGTPVPPPAPPQAAQGNPPSVAPPVPPGAQKPLPPRVQGSGSPVQPGLLDPAFGGRPGAAARQPDNIFGEDLVSEKSLDEVILNYLADDLSTGKPPPK